MDSILSVIALAAALNNMPTDKLAAVCFVESSHNPQAYAPNDGGSPSIGLCQIKLATARFMGFKGHPKLLFDAQVNAFYAGKYLAYQHKRYKNNWKLAISAYNAGSASTKNAKYVNKVMKLAYDY